MPASREALADRVRRAIARVGMTQADLATAVGMDASALSRALSGKRNFKSLEIALIAQTLRVSTQELLADEDERQEVMMAARAQPNTNPAIDAALARAHEILELDQLLCELGFSSSAEIDVRPCDSLLPFEQGTALAEKLRSEIGLHQDDLPYELSDLAAFLEQRLGFDIGFEPLPPGLDGLSVCHQSFRLALVSSGVSATRQRFTLAHELGHLLAGDSQELRVDENLFSRNTPEEVRANAFAAAFLMPAEALRNVVPRGFVPEGVIAQLLGRFGVSLDALAFRLHNVGLINAGGRDRIRSMSSSRIALRSGRTADLQARNDQRAPGNLLYRAAEAYVGGQISIRPLARLLSVDPEQLLEELAPPNRRVQPDDLDSTVPAL